MPVPPSSVSASRRGTNIRALLGFAGYAGRIDINVSVSWAFVRCVWRVLAAGTAIAVALPVAAQAPLSDNPSVTVDWRVLEQLKPNDTGTLPNRPGGPGYDSLPSSMPAVLNVTRNSATLNTPAVPQAAFRFEASAGSTSTLAETMPPVRGSSQAQPAVLVSAPAADALFTPGSAWSEGRLPNSRQPEERRNAIIETTVQQGVDFWTPVEGVAVGAFIQADAARDTERFDYNNYLKGAVGLRLRWIILPPVRLQIGAKYETDYRYSTDENLHGWIGFINWAARWSRSASTDPSSAFPLRYLAFTWGEVLYPSGQERNERRNWRLRGAAEAGVDWFRVGSGVVLNTFIDFQYRTDREEFDWNNKVEPGIGAKIKLAVSDDQAVELGAKYINEYRFKSSTHVRGPIVFLNWSAWW